MERYREISVNTRQGLMWMWLAVIALLVWLGWEIYSTMHGKVSILGYGYIIFFFGLLIWRYALKYTYILTDKELIIITQGLGINNTYTVDLALTESYTNKYVRKFFRKTKISKYIHRYSSADTNPTRLLVINKNGKLHGILFRVSDRFIDELRTMMPNKFLDMRE